MNRQQLYQIKVIYISANRAEHEYTYYQASSGFQHAYSIADKPETHEPGALRCWVLSINHIGVVRVEQ